MDKPDIHADLQECIEALESEGYVVIKPEKVEEIRTRLTDVWVQIRKLSGDFN